MILVEGSQLRMLSMPCCGHALSWLGSRLPNFCPECGKLVFEQLRTGGHTDKQWSVIITGTLNEKVSK
jgi:hypothetical protein